MKNHKVNVTKQGTENNFEPGFREKCNKFLIIEYLQIGNTTCNYQDYGLRLRKIISVRVTYSRDIGTVSTW